MQCRRCNGRLCQDCINGWDICYMCAGAYESSAEGCNQIVLGTSGPVCAHSMDAECSLQDKREQCQGGEGFPEGSDGVKVVDKESDKQKEERGTIRPRPPSRFIGGRLTSGFPAQTLLNDRTLRFSQNEPNP